MERNQFVSSFSTLTSENLSGESIEVNEETIIESFEKAAKEESFYKHPTKKILEIVGKSEIEDIELLCEVISRMCENKGEESVLLLNVIDPKEATIDECIKVLSKFDKCPICKRTGELFDEHKNLPERDYIHEINELRKEIEKLQNIEKEKEKKTRFPPVTKKPLYFERDIFKASCFGMLASIQYLIEQCHVDVEIKDKDGYTPLNKASSCGRLEVVQYLYEVMDAHQLIMLYLIIIFILFNIFMKHVMQMLI